MVSSAGRTGAAHIGDRRLSTVVPASATRGGERTVYELSDMDLAMKLHYVRGLYYFPAGAGAGVNVRVLKEPLFRLLDDYFPICGRVRVEEEEGRPFLKCNDSGVRIVEATCDVTLEEWLAPAPAPAPEERSKHLVPHNFLGPNLNLSPLVLIQFTWFKGGGFVLGLSWSHLLGDATSATNFINRYGRILGGDHSLPFGLPQSLNYYSVQRTGSETDNSTDHLKKPRPPPQSFKHVNAVDNHWVAANEKKMETTSFHINHTKLMRQLLIQTNLICNHDGNNVKPFEALCALVWKSITRSREDNNKCVEQPIRTITVCRPAAASSFLANSQKIYTVVVEDHKQSPSEMELVELARLIADRTSSKVDQSLGINEQVDDSSSSSSSCIGLSHADDLIVYGANLTFVDMVNIDFYGLQVMGQKPALVDYTIEGVGDEGTILVLPDGDADGGTILKAILPQDQLLCLRQEIATVWDILA